jgi:prepilin-type N-terminal cleavage/methylation domain-containing protein
MKTKNGFTIVELIVVIAVIGILAGIVVVSFSGTQKRAQKSSFEATAQQVKLKLGEYRTDRNGYPRTKADVVSYLNSTEGGTSALAADFNKSVSSGQVFAYTTPGCPATPALCTTYEIRVTKDKWSSTDSSESDIVVRP